PGLYNLAWHKEFHWDGGIVNLEVQPLAPITAPNEMAEEIQQVLEKLKVDPEYPQMFKKAFGDETINSQRMLKAITQFVASMVSADSKYDRVKRGQETFTAMEEAGYAVFSAKCASCHQEPLFTDQSYRNIGLPENPYLKDKGRMNITGRSADSLKFKVPSLRNVALTFPYAHDGRFYSIEQMIDHYRSGVQQSATVDPLVKNGIPISDVEKAQLVAFLRTLTDNSFINDPRFAENN
ncbi:MAG TPA: cytochrome c peroxidase, partial [Parasegetibacter sp.]